MVQLLRPGQVKVETKEGEVELHITLDLNINLQTGDLKISAKNEKNIESSLSKEEETEEEMVKFEIPKFQSKEKIKFGIKGE